VVKANHDVQVLIDEVAISALDVAWFRSAVLASQVKLIAVVATIRVAAINIVFLANTGNLTEDAFADVDLANMTMI